MLSYVFGFIAWELPRVHHQPAGADAEPGDDALDHIDPGA